MFWRFSFGTLSYVDELLNKEDITLWGLVESEECTVDDIIQEVKARNHKLLNLITERDTIISLLRSILDPPAPPNTEADKEALSQAKYTRVACEVFCCESQEICDTIGGDEELMGLLFSFVDTEEPLHNGLAGYFGRVVCSLLFKSGQQTLKYLEENPVVLNNLLRHTSSSSVGEIIIRVAASDEEWVANTSLVETLLEKLSPGKPADEQVNAAEVLCGINTDIYPFSNPVKQKLYNKDNIKRLCTYAFETPGKIMVPAIMVFTNLLVGVGRNSDGEEDGEDGQSAGVQPYRSAMFEVVHLHTSRIVSLLDVACDGAVQEMPYGVIKPPFGVSRLRVVELLRVLLWIAGAEVESALIASQALPKCLETFLRYPFNNLLHSSVEGLVTFALEEDTPQLANHLVLDFDLATFVARAPLTVTPEPLPGSSRGPTPLRAGYIGHLTRIGNKLIDRARKYPDIAESLAANEEWQSYVSTTLEECNQKDDIENWACGRPAQAFGEDDEGMGQFMQ
mmetsp:Transcript_5879/g.16479  ORF Transcript_5879/g.16479 Transcript_5879/m.16479 type:complete len:509 (+) Transcript_5879:402-1928(+)|eukprot:CAMPEP_0117656128 /NCGR_PEP_ID=MMETSP0804-20121206/4641_1 /TAXON_ID=1074897 /ORGANISM="Tetraselmis astigmatica, Strain CCMP880" /LENGTH=508 /DNA_ID=CAMNT_0005462513 /DNA_START=323 /DNA_END=1849 /DNA_ORIENTATION=-